MNHDTELFSGLWIHDERSDVSVQTLNDGMLEDVQMRDDVKELHLQHLLKHHPKLVGILA
jgi:hypothetical protein